MVGLRKEAVIYSNIVIYMAPSHVFSFKAFSKGTLLGKSRFKVILKAVSKLPYKVFHRKEQMRRSQVHNA